MFEKIIIVTRKTRLEELIERFNTRSQAKFYIEHSGGDFAEYEKEHENYNRALDTLRTSLDFGLKLHYIDRAFLPTYLFTRSDLVIALGQDGLVANTAKYVGEQPILGVNPDPQRYDGILVPLPVDQARRITELTLEEHTNIAQVTLAEVRLQDGQRLLAFNDLYIGVKSHISARYQISFNEQSETQSSSGVIVSTGAGSTGWLSSIFNMVGSIGSLFGIKTTESFSPRLDWDDPALVFAVREPFVSKHSSADIVFGCIEDGMELTIESKMPTAGTIFSDGVESDFLEFNSGAIASIGVADQRAHLVLPRTNTVAAKKLATGVSITSASHKNNRQSQYSALGTSR